jgi:hypothetical protein
LPQFKPYLSETKSGNGTFVDLPLQQMTSSLEFTSSSHHLCFCSIVTGTKGLKKEKKERVGNMQKKSGV